MAKEYSDKQFNKDFKTLTEGVLSALKIIETREEAQRWLDMLEGLASQPYSPATAKAIYGYAYLMEDKPWYDFERGFSAVKEAAETAPDNEPFCWYILGTMYLNGRKDIPRDPIQGKYWIDKAAAVGYHNAQVIQEIEWGNNPPGFKEWLGKRLEKEEQIRRIALPCIIMIVIALIAYFIFR